MSLDVVPADSLLNIYVKPYDAASATDLAGKWKSKDYNHLDKWNDIFKWQDEHAQLINGLNDTVRQNLLNKFNNDNKNIIFFYFSREIARIRNRFIIFVIIGCPIILIGEHIPCRKEIFLKKT